MALLIDSSIVITVERRGMPLPASLGGHADEELLLSVITVSELLTGVYRAAPGRKRQARAAFVEDLIERLRVLPIDTEVARVHALLGARLTSLGASPGAHDLLIGATAVVHGATVVTENLKDFERIPGLRVFRPEW